MNRERASEEKAGFIAVAKRHGLLGADHADQVVSFADEHDLHVSDAALQLSILHSHEVEAIGLLSEPKGLAPGYELTGLLGCGAAGMVFRARQIALDREVALKTIHPQSHQGKGTGGLRIQREAHAIARLQHPGIVSAIDSGFYQGRFCITMELVEGETLVDYIARSKEIPELTVWQIARQVAHALAHASEQGIVHRDIKPANLLLCDPPKGTSLPSGVPLVKVADFGLAFDDRSNQITATGVSLGTPAYVAPEQLNDPHVDHRADIYSLGATVFHMLTGVPPCIGHSPMRTIMRKSIGDQSWRDEMDGHVSSASRSLFREMTETKLDDRVADYEVLIKRINQLIADLEMARDHVTAEFAKPRSSLGVSCSADHELASTSGRSWPSFLTVGINKSIRKKSLGFVSAFLFVVLTAAAAAAFYLAFRMRDSSHAHRVDSVRWTVDGFPEPLFNGSSVPLFRQSGRWLTGSAADGSRVLVGKEGARMTIPLVIDGASKSNARFRVAVNFPDDNSVGTVVLSTDQNEEIASLHISKFEARFESKWALVDDHDDPIRALSVPGGSVFHQIAIHRESNRIRLTFDGKSIGTTRDDTESLVSVELRSESGSVNFADIDQVQLRPVAGG